MPPWLSALLEQASAPVALGQVAGFVLATSGMEIASVVLTLAMVVCNARQIHWAWPLTIAASALYGLVFWRTGLLGQVFLQGVFILTAIWGWWQWLRGTRQHGAPLVPRRLNTVGWVWTGAGSLAVGGFTAWWLIWLGNRPWTDLAMWADVATTAFSLVAQVLLARKFMEVWAVWLGINAASAVLFASQGLPLTAALYIMFLGLSMWGWRSWNAAARTHQAAEIERVAQAQREREHAEHLRLQYLAQAHARYQPPMPPTATTATPAPTGSP
jgi:nicotinamide mononucleotide transporter